MTAPSSSEPTTLLATVICAMTDSGACGASSGDIQYTAPSSVLSPESTVHEGLNEGSMSQYERELGEV